MKKWLLRIVIGLVVLLVVAIGGGLAFVSTIDKGFVEEQIAEATGRDVSIGALDLNIVSSMPSVSLRNLTIANASWGTAPHFVKLDALDAEIALFPLFSGILDVQKVILAGADVQLETDAQGRSNTQFETAGSGEVDATIAEPTEVSAPDGGGSPILPILRLVDISGVTVAIKDAATQQENLITLDTVSVRGSAPDQPLDVTVEGRADELPISLLGQLGSPDAMLDAGKSWPVQLAGELAGIGLQLDGEILDPASGRGIDMVVAVAGDELADAARIAGVDVPTIGAFDVQAAITGDADDELQVSNLKVNVGNANFARIEVDGGITSATSLEGVDLQLLVEGLETAALSPVVEKFAGQAVPALGPYRMTASIIGGQSEGLSLRDLDFALGKTDLVVVNAKGSVGNLLEASGVSVGFVVEATELANLSPIVETYTGQSILAIGPLNVRGNVTGGLENGIQLSDLDLNIGTDDIVKIAANGTIADLLTQKGIAIGVAVSGVETGNLSPLAERYAGQSVPALGPFDIKANIAGDASDVLRLDGLDATVGRDVIEVAATGGIEDLIAQRGINLAISVASREIGGLSPMIEELAGQKVPALGPLDLKANVSGALDSGIALSNLNLDLGSEDIAKVLVTGGIANLLDQSGLDLTIDVAGTDTGNLSPVAVEMAGQSVPSLGPFDIKAVVNGGVNSTLSLRDIGVSVGQADTLLLAVQGAVGDLVALTGVDVAVSVDSPSLANLSTPESPQPDVGPVKVRARALGNLTDNIKIDGLSAEIGRSDLAGNASASLQGTRPVVTVNVTSNLLDLSEFEQQGQGGQSGGSSASAGGSGGAAQPSDGKVIPNDPLPFDALKLVDADVSVKIARLIVSVTEMTNAEAVISLKNGDLHLSPFKANAAGGLVDADIRLNGSKDVADLGVTLTGQNLDIGGVMELAGINGVINGPLTVDVKLAGLGNTPRALAGSLDGHAKVLVTGGTMNKQAMIDEFGEGVTVLTSILFANKDNVVVNCMVADYVLASGLATTQVGVLDTEISTVTYDGDINLKTEELDLDVTPQGSVAGTVSIGIPVAVGGIFASPSFGIQGEKLLLGVGLGLLTGGAAPALGALLSQDLFAGDACQDLKTGGGSEAPPAAAAPVQPVTPAAPSTPQEAIEGVLKKGLQGLFGN